MATVTFNKTVVKQVAVSPLQEKGATPENQALIIQYENGNQLPLKNGLATLANLAKQNQSQLDELQARKEEIEGLQKFISENIK